MLLKAAAVRDADGEIEAAVTIIEDVTDAKRRDAAHRVPRARRRACSPPRSTTSRRCATSPGSPCRSSPTGARSTCSTRTARREPVAVAHIDPGEARDGRAPARVRARGARPRARARPGACATGEPPLYNEIPDELLVEAAVDERAPASCCAQVGHARRADRADDDPRAHDRRDLTLVSAESGRSFDDGRRRVRRADRRARRRSPSRAPACTASARRIARTLQSSLLPEALPEIPGWEVAALYRPAGQESEVGGDFYDFWEVDGDWLMMIGDVTGKGVRRGAPSPRSSATPRGPPRNSTPGPAQILERVDAALRRRPSLSAVHGAVPAHLGRTRDGRRPAGTRCRCALGEDGVAEVGAHGTLLGAFERTQLARSRASRCGRRDAGRVHRRRHRHRRRRGRALRRGAACASCSATGGSSPTAIRERVVAALERFQVGAQADDTAMVIMRFAGGAGSGADEARTAERGGGGVAMAVAKPLRRRVRARGRPRPPDARRRARHRDGPAPSGGGRRGARATGRRN